MSIVTVMRIALLSMPLIFVAGGYSAAKDKANPAQIKSKFDRKTLAVNYKMGTIRTSALLQKAREGTIGRREFLVGEFAFDGKGDDADYNGVEIWIPLEKIENMMVFDNVDAARRVAEKAWQAESTDREPSVR